MMIEESRIADILAHVARRAGASDGQIEASLRERFSGIRLTVCSDDDMPSRIRCVAENAACRIYYVSSGEHCLSLTTDAAAASGLVVALIEPDEMGSPQ